jgi:hypothetical protein
MTGGAIDLSDARVNGDIELESLLVAPNLARSQVLRAQRTQVGGDIRIQIARGSLPTRSVPAFSLQYARVGGEVNITGDAPNADSESHGMVWSIDLRSTHVTGRLCFTDLDIHGSIQLDSARILGEVVFKKVRLLVVRRPEDELPTRKLNGVGLLPEPSPAIGAAFSDCQSGISFTKCEILGQINFPFAKVRGDVVLEESEFHLREGKRETITFTDACLANSVRIVGSKFPRGLSMTRAQIDGNVLLDLTEKIAGFEDCCWLRLSEARIRGALQVLVHPGETLIGRIDLSDAYIQRLVLEPRDRERMKGVSITLKGANIAHMSGLETSKDLELFLDMQPEDLDMHPKGPVRSGSKKSPPFEQGPWTNMIRTLRDDGKIQVARKLDVERQARLSRSSDQPLYVRFFGFLSKHVFQFGHGWHRTAAATFIAALILTIATGPLLSYQGRVRFNGAGTVSKKECPPRITKPPDDYVFQGLRFSLSGVLLLSEAPDKKDWDFCDDWAKSIFVSLRLLWWLSVGAAGIAIGLRVRRWE